ncbi:MAG: hypothetical protein ACK44D_08015 [Bacteroidia bacterium]
MKHWWFVLLPVFVFGSIALWVDDEAQTETYQVVIFFVAITLVLLLFLFMCLHTRINEKGIEVQFKPLMFKVRKIQWSDVVQVKVIEYSPLFDYGGWGYRKSFSGKKAALNVYGNQGLELMLKDDTKLMIGTQRKDDLNNYLSYIKRKYQLQQIVA